MEPHNDIQRELREMQSMLAGMSRTTPYHVPDKYFETLPDNIQNTMAIINTPDPELALPKHMPFEVPQGYFDALATNTINMVAAGKEMPHSLPQGYFDTLPQDILAKAKAQPRAKVIPLTTRIWKNVRWAAAALVVLGIGLGIYRTNTTDKNTTPSIQNQLAALPEATINSYIENHIDEFDTEMIAGNLDTKELNQIGEQLSEQDIINYLNDAGWGESTIN